MTSAPRYAFAEAIRGRMRFERLAGLHERRAAAACGGSRRRRRRARRRSETSPSPISSAWRRIAPRRGGGVRGAHVADDAHAVAQAGRQHRAHAVEQARRVALLRVLHPREVLARDRALGEALEDEIVELAPLRELDGRRDPVVGEARAGADAQQVWRISSSSVQLGAAVLDELRPLVELGGEDRRGTRPAPELDLHRLLSAAGR